jgi:hypothetical protein
VVDRDVVLRKLADLERYVGQVSEYRDITAEQYREDWRTQRIVERTLQMASVGVDIAHGSDGPVTAPLTLP